MLDNVPRYEWNAKQKKNRPEQYFLLLLSGFEKNKQTDYMIDNFIFFNVLKIKTKIALG